MTARAVAGQALELALNVTGLAGQIAVRPVERKAGIQVLEGGHGQGPQKQQHQAGDNGQVEGCRCSLRVPMHYCHPSASELRLVKGVGVMAATAIAAKMAGMAVVVPMAAVAVATGIGGVAAVMALLAGKFCVFAGQRKIGLVLVVKFPTWPVCGVVALGAVFAEPTLVNVVLLVAVDAGAASLFIGLVEVTAVAQQVGVKAEQRKAT